MNDPYFINIQKLGASRMTAFGDKIARRALALGPVGSSPDHYLILRQQDPRITTTVVVIKCLQSLRWEDGFLQFLDPVTETVEKVHEEMDNCPQKLFSLRELVRRTVLEALFSQPLAELDLQTLAHLDEEVRRLTVPAMAPKTKPTSREASGADPYAFSEVLSSTLPIVVEIDLAIGTAAVFSRQEVHSKGYVYFVGSKGRIMLADDIW